MRRLSARDQYIVGVAVILLGVVLTVVFAIRPPLGELGKLEGKLKAANVEVQAAEALVKQRQDAKVQAAETQARLLRLANQVPDAAEMPSLIIGLQDAANESGLLFVKVAPEQSLTSGGSFSALTLALTVKGTWNDLIEYLSRVREMTREVRVLTIRISPAPVSDLDQREDLLSTDIILNAYTMPSVPVAPGVPGAPAAGAAN